MNEIVTGDGSASKAARPGKWKRVLLIIFGVLFVVGVGAGLALWAKYKYLRAHADEMLRARVIESLSARFHSPVELDGLHLDASDGVKVTGNGLRILYLAGPTVPDANKVAPPPMLSIDSFEFHTEFKELFKPTTRILAVYVQGMQLDIPPRQPHGANQRDNPKLARQPKISIVVDKIVCTDSKVVIETSKPGKLPLSFEIASVTLTDVGTKKPLLYDATLTNPKPVGQVHSTGHFGPWQADNPRDTAIDGDYTFTNADLSTFKGIAGVLSSTGNFKGSLGQIAVAGKTDIPDFRLDTSDHPVPLHTDFKAEVDGLSGDTYLKQVDAKMLHSSFHASGSVVRLGVPATGVTGHDTELDITMGPNDHARIEDMLTLAIKTVPPILQGSLMMKAHLSLPPGKESVSKKMALRGNFTINSATFSNPKFQGTVDDLSMRAQGRPKDANAADADKVNSAMSGDFSQANAVMDLPRLAYSAPGVQVNLAGQYSLDGQRFEFKGDVRTDATMSQMTTGWKSMLLKPFDPLLKKDGAGVVLPVTISGTKSAPKFGVDTKRLFR